MKRKLYQKISKGLFLFLAGLFFTCASPEVAMSQILPLSEDQRIPQLRINTDMHTARIKRISTDSKGELILTCSVDKTAKLWDSTTGELIRTFYPPTEGDSEGRLYACALSPDGEIVILGGNTRVMGSEGEYCVYVFNAKTGELLAIIPTSTHSILDIEYSHDGAFIAIGHHRQGGVYILEATTYRVYKKLEGYGDAVYGLDFSSLGMLATVSYDGYVRLYDQQFNLTQKSTLSGGDEPNALSFSPDSQKIAVSFNQELAIQVIDGHSLDSLFIPDFSDLTEGVYFGNIAWSHDGLTLYSSGVFEGEIGEQSWGLIRGWEDSGRGKAYDFYAGQDSTQDLVLHPEGDLFFAGSSPDWGRITPEGVTSLYKTSEVLNFRFDDKSVFKVNQTGNEIEVAPIDEDPMLYTLTTFSLMRRGGSGQFFSESGPGLVISEWESSFNPLINGEPLKHLKTRESNRSVDVTSSGESFLMGADWSISLLDKKGDLIWRHRASSVAWAVKFSLDEKVAVAAFGDGTIRWFRVQDGQELMSLFILSDMQEWVLWTPKGYYACSEEGENLIGWHVNNVGVGEASFYTASIFSDYLHRPDILSLILETLDEEEAIKKANEALGIQGESDILQILSSK